MKAYWITHEADDRVRLELRDVPRPAPGPGEIVLRVQASSLNRGDLLGAIQRHKATEGRPAGVDAAGEVAAVGDGVAGFSRGDRVMARARGCFAEYVLADALLATPIPPHLSWEQAAAIPIAFITAWEALVQYGRLKGGERLLIAGASSGVGVAALQLAKTLGAFVICVTGSPQKLERLRALGADVVMAGRNEDFSRHVLDATRGRGVDLAVNLVGGTAFGACQKSLADFGRLALVGYVDRVMQTGLDLETLHGKRLEIFGISNAPLTREMRASATRGFERDVMPAISDRRIVPVIDRVFAFDEVAQAKAYSDAGTHVGKIVIRMD